MLGRALDNSIADTALPFGPWKLTDKKGVTPEQMTDRARDRGVEWSHNETYGLIT